jgi:hypothetical protein
MTAEMPRQPVPPAIRLVGLAICCWLVVLGSTAAARWMQHEAPALIKVRWAPTVSPAARAALETRYSLAEPQLDEATSFRYVLHDGSRENIRALVQDAAVLDTHDIDRSAFRIADTAPRTDAPGGPSGASVMLQRIRITFAVAGSVIGILGLALALVPLTPWGRRHAWLSAPGAIRYGLQTGAAALYGWLPSASPRQVAAFRIALGMALLAFFVDERVNAAAVPLSLRSGSASIIERMTGQVLIAAPWLADWVTPWIAIAAVLFIAGALSRFAFALLAAGALLWGSVYSLRYGSHPASALLLTMLCLLPSRWGDAWSVDAWWRRRGGQPAPAREAREYGYTIWLPGFVLGVALFAAAVAKLREGGAGWILNGTIKYHFLTDVANAPVDWGLQFGLYPRLAIAASLAAVLIEATVLLGAVSRQYWKRAAAGVGTVLLLAGFYLFQGIFWAGWWTLALSFLPWHWIDRDAPGADGRGRRGWPPRVGYVYVALAAIVVGQQIVVSSQKLEVGPLLSTYDMYSRTYNSPAAYERSMSDEYRLVAQLPGNRTETCRVDVADGPALLAHADGMPGADPRLVENALRDCFAGVDGVQRVDVEVARFAIDWARWKPLGTVLVRSAGPLPAVH